MGRSPLGNGPNCHKSTRKKRSSPDQAINGVAFPLQQPSPSPQDELLFKAGLLARVRSTGTPSQRFRQWSQRAFVALTVGRSCFGFAPNSLFTAPSRNWRDHIKLKRLHYTSNHFIRQGGKTLLSLPFLLRFDSFRNTSFSQSPRKFCLSKAGR